MGNNTSNNNALVYDTLQFLPKHHDITIKLLSVFIKENNGLSSERISELYRQATNFLYESGLKENNKSCWEDNIAEAFIPYFGRKAQFGKHRGYTFAAMAADFNIGETVFHNRMQDWLSYLDCARDNKNFYALVISILNSPKSGFTVRYLKMDEIIKDWKRYRRDKEYQTDTLTVRREQIYEFSKVPPPKTEEPQPKTEELQLENLSEIEGALDKMTIGKRFEQFFSVVSNQDLLVSTVEKLEVIQRKYTSFPGAVIELLRKFVDLDPADQVELITSIKLSKSEEDPYKHFLETK